MSQAAQASPSQAGDAALPAAGAHAEHQAIARQLQEITATLGLILAELADSKPDPARTIQAGPIVPFPSPPPGGPVDEGALPQSEASGQEFEPVKHESTQFISSNLDRSVQNRQLWVRLLASVYFPSNSAELLPSEKIVLIDLLPLVRDKQLLFVGYADRASDGNTNRRLSYKRARAVKAFFLHTRHNPAKLFAGSLGSCCDKADGNTPTEQQQNRRVEIYHTPERLQLTSPPFIKE